MRALPASINPQPQVLPYGRQTISDEDIAAVAEALRDDLLTSGVRVPAFEAALAAAVGAEHAIAVANGTAALHLALMALDLQPGDVCIVPTITFLATANAVRFCGGEVVFADVDPATGLMTAATLEDAVRRAAGRRVRAILPVHYAGPMVDLTAIAPIAARVGAAIIEDACHALGSRDRDGNTAGGCQQTTMATFSFHPVKTIACGEGGAITTNDATIAARLRRLRSHGMERDRDAFVSPDLGHDVDGGDAPWSYEMAELGYNYRLTDFQAALGHSQLTRLSEFLAKRRMLVAQYLNALAPMAPHVRPVIATPGSEPGWHLMVALIDFAAIGRTRREVMADLRADGIGSQVHYIPVHTQTYYRTRYGVLDLPGSAQFYARCLSLPLFPAMTNDDPHRVAAALARALRL